MHKLFTKTLLGLLAAFAPMAYAQTALLLNGADVGVAPLAVCNPNAPANVQNVCLTQAPYYGSSDGATTTTASGTFAAGTSGTVASCSTFSPNQGVFIAGAGAAGGSTTASTTNASPTVTVASATGIGVGQLIQGSGIPLNTYVTAISGTTLTLSANATATAAGVAVTTAANYIGTVSSCSGSTLTVSPATTTAAVSGATVQHDETAAYRAAQSAIATKGGNIYLPCGTFLINGPLQDTSGANAVLPLPSIVAYSTNPIITVAVHGCDMPSVDNTQFGTIIQSSLYSGNLVAGYAAGGTYPGFTAVWATFDHIDFRLPATTNAVALNLTNALAAQVDHVWGDLYGTGTAGASSGFLYMPTIANNVSLSVNDATCVAYNTCFSFTEHTHIASAYAANCVNAFKFDNGSRSGIPGTYYGNTASADYLWQQQCTNGIVGPTSTNQQSINVQVFDSELVGTNDISDPSNLLRGEVHISRPYTQSAVTVNGAANLHVLNLTIPTVAFAGPPGLNAGNGSNGLINWYANSLTANASMSNPAPGELQVNTESTNGTSFQVQGQTTNAISNVRTACTTCYADLGTGTYPNWINMFYFPAGWTSGGYYDKPNTGVIYADTGATNGIIFDTGATAKIQFGTHNITALTLSGSDQSASFTSTGNVIAAFTSSNIYGDGISVANTSAGGKQYAFLALGSGYSGNGTTGDLSLQDLTSNMRLLSFTDAGTKAPSAYVYGWSSAADPIAASSAVDTGLSRTAANTIAIGNGTAADASGTLKVATVVHATSTVASLPAAATAGAGALRVVTDATATTGGTCTGGGTNYSVALSTGSAWTCH